MSDENNITYTYILQPLRKYIIFETYFFSFARQLYDINYTDFRVHDTNIFYLKP